MIDREELMDDLSEWLESAMFHNKLSRKEVARRAEVSEVALSRYISKQRVPSVVTFARLVEACDGKVYVMRNVESMLKQC